MGGQAGGRSTETMMEMVRRHLVWEWNDRAGLEHLQFSDCTKAEALVVADVNGYAVRFRYVTFLNEDSSLRRLLLFTMKGSEQRTMQIDGRSEECWDVDGTPRAELDGCRNLDLVDSPFTKSLLIRSLRLAVDEVRAVRVAVIDNRKLTATPVIQQWKRVASAEPDLSEYRCTIGETKDRFLVDKSNIVVLAYGRWRLMTDGLSHQEPL